MSSNRPDEQSTQTPAGEADATTHYNPEAMRGVGFAPDLGTQPPDENVVIWPPAAAAADPRTRARVAETDERVARTQGVSSVASPVAPEPQQPAQGTNHLPEIASGAAAEQRASSLPGAPKPGK